MPAVPDKDELLGGCGIQHHGQHHKCALGFLMIPFLKPGGISAKVARRQTLHSSGTSREWSTRPRVLCQPTASTTMSSGGRPPARDSGCDAGDILSCVRKCVATAMGSSPSALRARVRLHPTTRPVRFGVTGSLAALSSDFRCGQQWDPPQSPMVAQVWHVLFSSPHPEPALNPKHHLPS